MIWKNFFRELGYTMSRLVSVIIITAVAIMVYVGLTGIVSNSDRIVNDYFKQQNIASYWISGAAFDSRDLRKLGSVKGVVDMQPRIVLEAQYRYDEDVTLALYGISGGYRINTPLIIKGAFPSDAREMMLSDAFAQVQGLQLGDTYEMKLTATGTIIKKKICALIKAPERMNHTNAANPTPDFSKYGFAYMNEEAVADVLGKDLYNQICVTTEESVSDSDIKRDINQALGNKVINVLALEDNMAAYRLSKQINSIKVIIFVFPLIFFLVAVLIMFSTMTRLIENARMSIGMFKALGYPDRTILLYYVLPAALVVLLGFIVGELPAMELITKIVLNAFILSMDIPEYRLVPEGSALVTAFILACVFCIGAAFIVTARALFEKPAECMRPKPPKKVKKILLERIARLWQLLTFSQKYVVRNILRNKMRMLICVVGVVGCMTLTLTAFCLYDSITYYTHMLETNEHQYDVHLIFNSALRRAQYQRLIKIDGVSDVQFEMIANAKVYSADKLETTTFTIAEDIVRLKLPDTFSQAPFVMPEGGAIFEKDLADKLGLGAGDSAIVKFADKNAYYEVRILDVLSGVNGIYASREYWRGLGRDYKPTLAYIKTENPDALMKKLDDYDFVTSVKAKTVITEAVTEKINSLVLIVVILIIFGGILALVVLYNLGIMSFHEQIRSLATLMVLGFFDKETRKLLLSENIVFTVMGIIIGAPLGVKLAETILTSIATFNFILWVRPLSYAFSAAISLGFAVIVNLTLGKMMKRIDMLGALKSVE